MQFSALEELTAYLLLSNILKVIHFLGIPILIGIFRNF
jgi:hypothetical protein